MFRMEQLVMTGMQTRKELSGVRAFFSTLSHIDRGVFIDLPLLVSADVDDQARFTSEAGAQVCVFVHVTRSDTVVL